MLAQELRGESVGGPADFRQLRNWSEILPFAKRMDRAFRATVTSFEFLIFSSCFFDLNPPSFDQPVASWVLLPYPIAKPWEGMKGMP